MKVLVVSEGPHELGDSEHEGALVILVRRILGNRADCSVVDVRDPGVRVHLRPGETGGFRKRALGWLRYAERQGFEALVLVIDQDGYKERERQIAEAQSDSRLALPRALGVAIRSFDAWILADEKALSRVLRFQVSCQKAPEEIRDPKAVCRQLLQEGGDILPQRELYADTLRLVAIELLEQRCPRGFAPFAQRMRSL
jgi:hypothetical protein